MADGKLITAGLEVLENLPAVLMEAAPEAAVSSRAGKMPGSALLTQELRQTRADVVILADACEVLVRRCAREAPSSSEGRAGSP